MRMLFRQRFFSWFSSYDIFDENQNVLYRVKGELAWGHCLRVYNHAGEEVGLLKERVLTLLPRFRIYVGGRYCGEIIKEFTLFKPRFTLDFNSWRVEGDFFAWDYRVMDGPRHVMSASKQLLQWTDTYTIDVAHQEDALCCLMIVLAIDAAKASANRS